MEEMPFKLLLIVLLFGFTLSVGLKALEGAKEAEEEISARKALSVISTKLQLVAMGAPGAMERAEFELAGDARLILRNEVAGKDLFGRIDVAIGGMPNMTEIAALPFGDREGLENFSSTYLEGRHSITFTHEIENGERHYISVG